jgi:hypothetical protein
MDSGKCKPARLVNVSKCVSYHVSVLYHCFMYLKVCETVSAQKRASLWRKFSGRRYVRSFSCFTCTLIFELCMLLCCGYATLTGRLEWQMRQ